jgi:hypothetical protein
VPQCTRKECSPSTALTQSSRVTNRRPVPDLDTAPLRYLHHHGCFLLRPRCPLSPTQGNHLLLCGHIPHHVERHSHGSKPADFASLSLIRTLVYKPKTASAATPVLFVVIAKDDSTEANSGTLGKKPNLKEMRTAIRIC